MSGAAVAAERPPRCLRFWRTYVLQKCMSHFYYFPLKPHIIMPLEAMITERMKTETFFIDKIDIQEVYDDELSGL